MAAPSILVSGIGIAGPTLAYWLGRAGWAVTLVEHAPALRTGGYIVDFWGRGYDVAERMGLLPRLHREGYDVEELRLVDGDGRRVGGFDFGVFGRLANDRFVSLPRGDLAAALFDALEGRHECLFGDEIAALEQDGAGVEVAFERAPPRRFDAVIGADGLHSRVRRLAFGGEAMFEEPLGYVGAAFETEGYRPRDEGVYVSYAAPGRQVARFALRGDRTLVLFVYAEAADGHRDLPDMAAQKRRLHAVFGDAGWECPAILDALERSDELYFDRVSQIRMPAWSRGRVALVGDAAFAPSLLAGQGTALAMTAAYVMAGELAQAPGDPAAAFARCEERLRGFIDGKQKTALKSAASFAPRTRLGVWTRNRMSRALRIPGVARLVLGGALTDRLALPDYPFDNA